jgi:cystathionine gamma-synthase
MKTLHLRVQCQNNTALRMAQFLEEHPKVRSLFLLFRYKVMVFSVSIALAKYIILCSQIARVYYPGLPSHPEHHIAKSQMTGFGGVVSFEVFVFHKSEISELGIVNSNFLFRIGCWRL